MHRTSIEEWGSRAQWVFGKIFKKPIQFSNTKTHFSNISYPNEFSDIAPRFYIYIYISFHFQKHLSKHETLFTCLVTGLKSSFQPKKKKKEPMYNVGFKNKIKKEPALDMSNPLVLHDDSVWRPQQMIVGSAWRPCNGNLQGCWICVVTIRSLWRPLDGL